MGDCLEHALFPYPESNLLKTLGDTLPPEAASYLCLRCGMEWIMAGSTVLVTVTPITED